MVITLLIAIVAVLVLQALAQQFCVRLDARKFPAVYQTLPNTAAEASRFQIPAQVSVTVISGAYRPPMRLAEHQAIATHSLHGKHLIAEKGAHWVHLDQPELIVQAFFEMAEKLKVESIESLNRK